MTLYFSLKAPDSSVSSPCVCCAEFDVLMDVLNSFIAVGNILVSAYLIDEDGARLDLPVEVFDGMPVGHKLRTLTDDYQHVLRVLY